MVVIKQGRLTDTLSQFNYRTESVLPSELMEALVQKDDILIMSRSRHPDDSLSLNTFLERTSKSQSHRQGYELIHLSITHLGQHIYFDPSNGRRLNDENGLNDWFLKNKRRVLLGPNDKSLHNFRYRGKMMDIRFPNRERIELMLAEIAGVSLLENSKTPFVLGPIPYGRPHAYRAEVPLVSVMAQWEKPKKDSHLIGVYVDEVENSYMGNGTETSLGAALSLITDEQNSELSKVAEIMISAYS